MTRPSGIENVVVRVNLRHVAASGYVQHVLPTVRVVLIRAEQAEVLHIHIQFNDTRRNLPISREDSAVVAPGLGTLTA